MRATIAREVFVELARLDGSRVAVGTVFCIGRNVFAHALELGNEVPDEPLVFLKSAGAVRPLDATGVIAFPDEAFHHEAEVVVVVGEPVPLGAKVGWDVVEGVALGLDLTRRQVQSALKAKGHPWVLAKSFQGAAPVGPVVPLARFADPGAIRFTLHVDGELRQSGDLRGLSFPIPELLTRLAALQPLVPGDIVFTGTPAGVADLRVGQPFVLAFEEPALEFAGRL
ncbi:MAG: fumarylacetoacetate hydrolase family protein [Alphaproteobacteria bacterium]|nr:fumarylacetoacetate hydrolase family protein [Alphaproteobacteria bacterium]